MGRLRRELYINAIYHVYNRGNNRMDVFPECEDKEKFLELIVCYRKRFEFKIFAICLMNNHYHMILQANRRHNISRIIQALKLAYSSYYRRKYKYAGHLWQSRFQSKVIERETYLFECIDYIHVNPVKAKIVRTACDYLYSSAGIFEGRNECVGGGFRIDALEGALYS